MVLELAAEGLSTQTMGFWVSTTIRMRIFRTKSPIIRVLGPSGYYYRGSCRDTHGCYAVCTLGLRADCQLRNTRVSGLGISVPIVLTKFATYVL